MDYNFTEVIEDIMAWKEKDLTRTSDIIRLCIAHRYSMSYVDLDIMFLANSTERFLREYVPACIWGDEGLSSHPIVPVHSIFILTFHFFRLSYEQGLV